MPNNWQLTFENPPSMISLSIFSPIVNTISLDREGNKLSNSQAKPSTLVLHLHLLLPLLQLVLSLLSWSPKTSTFPIEVLFPCYWLYTSAQSTWYATIVTHTFALIITNHIAMVSKSWYTIWTKTLINQFTNAMQWQKIGLIINNKTYYIIVQTPNVPYYGIYNKPIKIYV